MTTRTKPTVTRNSLSAKQAFQLANWIIDNLERIKGQTRSTIATMATKELEFNVVDSNVTTAIDTTGADVGTRRATGERADRHQVLALELIDLLEHLGQPVSDRLRAVSMRRGQKV